MPEVVNLDVLKYRARPKPAPGMREVGEVGAGLPADDHPTRWGAVAMDRFPPSVSRKMKPVPERSSV